MIVVIVETGFVQNGREGELKEKTVNGGTNGKHAEAPGSYVCHRFTDGRFQIMSKFNMSTNASLKLMI